MPSKELLRTLIAAEIGLVVVGIVASLLTVASLPEPLRTFLETEAETDFTAHDVAMLATGVSLLVLWLVSSIGLLIFWRPARSLYMITIVVSVLVTPFFGPYVDAGWGTMFEEAAILVSGIVLAMIYFSPLKDFYEKPKTA